MSFWRYANVVSPTGGGGPEFARVYWHYGRYHYRSAKDRPAIILGSDIGSACFMAKLAIAKQADKAWRAYIQSRMGQISA